LKRTPLLLATYNKTENCVRKLIEAGCSRTIKDDDGKTALDVAKQFGEKRLIKLLNGEYVPPLVTKAKNLSKLDRIITASVDGSLSNYFDVHKVEYALVAKLMSLQGVATKIENILQVLWFGGELEHKDKRNMTAVMWSAMFGDVASLSILLEHGARIDVNAKNGWTPLHIAVKYGKVEMVQLLINAKARVDSKDINGWTPLHLAVNNGLKVKVTALIEAGADVMAKLNDGRNTLTLATMRARRDGNDDILELIKHVDI